MSHPSLPRLNNPGGQVEFLGNESRGRPNKPFGARILARVNESPGDVLVERRWKMVATCFHASTVTHRTRTWNHHQHSRKPLSSGSSRREGLPPLLTRRSRAVAARRARTGLQRLDNPGEATDRRCGH